MSLTVPVAGSSGASYWCERKLPLSFLGDLPFIS